MPIKMQTKHSRESTHMHAQTQRVTHAHTHARALTEMHAHIHKCTHPRAHTLAHAHAHRPACTRPQTDPKARTHTQTDRHRRMQTHTNTHKHTQTHASSRSRAHTRTLAERCRIFEMRARVRAGACVRARELERMRRYVPERAARAPRSTPHDRLSTREYPVSIKCTEYPPSTPKSPKESLRASH
jgi:hypothetical protein